MRGVAINKYRCFDGTWIHLIIVFTKDKIFSNDMMFSYDMLLASVAEDITINKRQRTTDKMPTLLIFKGAALQRHKPTQIAAH
jgi:hypothetical protein